MSTATRATSTTVPTVLILPVASLVPGHDFRIDDDPEQLAELAESIAAHGVLQPLLVRQLTGGGWEVVAGRRRLAAARTAGLDVVPCLVRALNDDASMDAALIENMHRRRLSPVEQGMAFARLRDKGLTQKQIAARVGRSEYYVSVLLRLLMLPKVVQNKVHAGKLSYSTAYKAWRQQMGGRAAPAITRGVADETTLRAVNHWRRRHDRLVAGIHAVLKARPRDVPEFRMMLDRLLKLDLQALDDAGENGQAT